MLVGFSVLVEVVLLVQEVLTAVMLGVSLQVLVFVGLNNMPFRYANFAVKHCILKLEMKWHCILRLCLYVCPCFCMCLCVIVIFVRVCMCICLCI